MLKEITRKELKEDWIHNIAEEWMLIAAGNEEGYNMMTASWGFVGEAWGSDAVTILVRPQRYTMEFLEKNDVFTISFYGENRAVHAVCGSKSGRDTDKTAEAGLTPVFTENGVLFEEARLVISCRKIYVDKIRPENIADGEILGKWYPEKDYHNLLIGKIEKIWVKS